MGDTAVQKHFQSILSPIYGLDTPEQAQRYERALTQFRATYGDTDPVDIFRAPGRVNLIGEHTDYNHGYVLPAALDKDIVLFARRRSDNQVRLSNIDAEFLPLTFEIGTDIPIGPVGNWGNYARGAAQIFAQQQRSTANEVQNLGFDGLIVGAAPHGVPQGAGLSSSSALTVVVAAALTYYTKWQPVPGELVQLCSDAEWYVGTRGGIMDQYTSLFAQRDHALFLDCRPDADDTYSTQHIPLPHSYRLLVVDSGVHHRNVRGEFNQRVAACRAGVGLLQQIYPCITHLRDLEEMEWEQLAPNLPKRVTVETLQKQGVNLGDIPGLENDTALRVQSCCHHVWSENRRVLQAVQAMKADAIDTLGALMNEAHTSAREDYAISCPEIEVLVEAARQVEGVAGARLTGAGWGGCIVALVHEESVDTFQQHVQQFYRAQTNRDCDIFPCRAGQGAGYVSTV